MSKLPRGWTQAKIGDLVTLNPKNETNDDTLVGFVPMSRLGVDFRSPLTYESRRWSDVKKGYTHLADGDVLLAKITPCFENGKAGLVCGLPNGLGAGSTEYLVNRPSIGCLEARYLLAFFKTEAFLKAGALQMTGSVGQKRVPKNYLLESDIPLAPLPEQTRIADKLDAVLARVDACRERLDRIPAILKRFRQAVLAAATSGKLTEGWRADQVARMQPQAESGNVARDAAELHYHVTSTLDSASLHSTLEAEDWQTATVSHIATAVFDGPFGSHLKSEDYSASGVRVIRLENIGWLSFAADKKTFIPVTKYESLAKHTLRADDALLSSFIADEVRVCLLPAELDGRAINKADCFCIRVNQAKCLPRFLAIRLACKSTYKTLNQSVHGATRPRINLGQLRAFEFLLPSLGEQTEIVRQVETLFAYADRLEARYKTARTQVEKLTPALLAKAFRGELVPQDANDEPASALLERIRAQHAAAPRPTKRVRKANTL